jgi:hypothetical protein
MPCRSHPRGVARPPSPSTATSAPVFLGPLHGGAKRRIRSALNTGQRQKFPDALSGSPMPSSATKVPNRARAASSRAIHDGPVTVPMPALMTTASPPAPYLVPAQELADLLDVNTRTLSNYVGAGMPVHTAKPRPLYSLADCLVWSSYYVHRTREFTKHRVPPPQRVTMRQARNWHLIREHEQCPDGAEYTLVPLRHDHPLRRRMLADACEGLPALPPLNDDQGDKHRDGAADA